MSEIVQVELPDGQVIWARVADAGEQDRPRDIGFGERTRAFAVHELSELAGAVVDNLRGALSQYDADEVSVDFGVELSMKSGKVISALAEIGGTESIVVHLTWKAPHSPSTQGPPLESPPPESAHPEGAPPDSPHSEGAPPDSPHSEGASRG
jgi:Trypsin-co-occurring domain 1